MEVSGICELHECLVLRLLWTFEWFGDPSRGGRVREKKWKARKIVIKCILQDRFLCEFLTSSKHQKCFAHISPVKRSWTHVLSHPGGSIVRLLTWGRNKWHWSLRSHRQKAFAVTLIIRVSRWWWGRGRGLHFTLFSYVRYEEKSLFTPGEFLKEKKINFYQWVIFFSARGIGSTIVSYFPQTLRMVSGHVFYDLISMSFSAEASCPGHPNFWIATGWGILESRYIYMKYSYRLYSKLTSMASTFCRFMGV